MEYKVPVYPAINFFIRWGLGIAVLVALAIASASIWAVVEHGLAWPWLLAGLLAAALGGGLFAVLTELLRIVADTLMPR